MTEGEHVLRISITGSFANIDWIKIANEKPDDKTGLAISHIDCTTLQKYRVFDLQGAYLGTIFAEQYKVSSQIKALVQHNGIYLVKGSSGMAVKIHIIK